MLQMYILFFIIQAIYKNNSSQNKCPVKLNFTGHLISYHSSAEREVFEPIALTAYISATLLSKFQIGNETVTIFNR